LALTTGSIADTAAFLTAGELIDKADARSEVNGVQRHDIVRSEALKDIVRASGENLHIVGHHDSVVGDNHNFNTSSAGSINGDLDLVSSI
jgi:hypothetical protein